jgi:hypothetical protein
VVMPLVAMLNASVLWTIKLQVAMLTQARLVTLAVVTLLTRPTTMLPLITLVRAQVSKSQSFSPSTSFLTPSSKDFGNVAGTSNTGNAEGGRGDGKGPGGNAYSGFAGPTRGGNVINEGGSIDNTGETSKC